MRVVILRSNPVAPDPRVEKTAIALHKAGYQVKIIGWDRTGTLPEQEGRGYAVIRRLPIKAQYGTGLANLPALLRWQAGLLSALWREDYYVIHACDFDTVLPALLACFWRGKKLVYDIFDFYADMLRRVPKWIKNIIRWLDLRVIGWADAVILADRSRRQQIAGSQPRLLEYIYNSPPDTAVVTGEKSDRFTIGYVGLLQKERGLLTMIDAVGRHPQWRLELAGFGGDEEEIRRAAAKYPNIHFYGTIDYEQALALSARADVLFATYDPAIPNHVYASPNKLFEAMMLGKPVIVAEGTGCAEPVSQWQNGFIVPYGDDRALEQALIRLAEEPELYARLAANSRRAYLECYSWEQMEQRLVNLYQRLEGRK